MKLTLILLVAGMLAGCGTLVPSERRASQSVQATEAIATETQQTMRRTFEVVPQAATAMQLSNGVPVAVSESLTVESRTTTGAGSEDRAKGTSQISIPLFVKVIGLAVGLGMLWLVLWIIRKQSVAAQAAWSAADRAVADSIDFVEAKARESTNPEELNKLNAELARLEKRRGKLASEKGGKR